MHMEMVRNQGVIQPKGFPGLPEGWRSETETILSADGNKKLFLFKWSQDAISSPATLLIIHGMGEHSGRYIHVPHYVQNQIGTVFALDLRGHGRSEGIRGHVDRFDEFADDVEGVIRKIETDSVKKWGRSEIHLLGHSMGGLVVLRTLLKRSQLPLKSVIVSAPLLGVKVPLGVAKRAAAHLLSHVYSTIQLDSEVNPKVLSHDPSVGEAYLADRLVHSKGTPKMYTEMLKAIDATLKDASGFEFPLMAILPGQDQVVDTEVSKVYFEGLQNTKKTIKIYNDFYHESFNELGKEKAFEDLCEFIKEQS